MKKILAILISLAAFSLSTALWAEAGKHAEDTELGERMEEMRDAFRTLRKQAADPAKRDQNLKLLADLKRAAVAATKLTPAKTADLPEKDREAFVADFQKDMREFVEVVEKLEHAVIEGKADEATKLVDELGGLSKKGHKEFKKPDDKH